MKQLRILVFSAAFGNGHLRAAEAVIEGIRIKEPRKIDVAGIPVSPRFEVTIDSKPIISELGLKPDLLTFLVMGAHGSLESTKKICIKLANSLVPVQLIIVCGNNPRLYHSLQEVITGARNLLARLRFVDNLEDLMPVSDLIITKAGGLTVTEALTRHLPLVIFKPIPGQEEENAHFLQRIGAGNVADTEEKLEELLEFFLSYPKEIKKMREKAAAALPGHSAERAVEKMLELRTNLRVEQKTG